MTFYAEPVGEYRLTQGAENSFHISMYFKPSFIHRFFMKHLLGFNWKEYKHE